VVTCIDVIDVIDVYSLLVIIELFICLYIIALKWRLIQPVLVFEWLDGDMLLYLLLLVVIEYGKWNVGAGYLILIVNIYLIIVLYWVVYKSA